MNCSNDITPPPGCAGAILVALLAVGPAGASAQGVGTVAAPHAEIALAAQGALRTAVAASRKAKTLDTLGLRSRKEADQATLGDAMAVREIGYDKLLALQPGADPATVFVGPPQVLYAVMVGSEPRSALTMVRKDSAWELSSYGDAERVASIFRAREALRTDAGGGADQTNLVVVPAFRLEFVVETRGDRTLLRPVVPGAAAEAGIKGTMEATKAIELLAAHAREFEKKYGEGIRQRRLVH